MLKSFANGTIFGQQSGAGAPNVLALHGWGGTRSQLEEAVKGFDAISLDLYGFGSTPPPPEVWGAAQYAAALEPVLEEMAAPVVIVGFSFGGRVAVSLAAQYPDLVKALVLTGAPVLRRNDRKKPTFAFRAMKAASRMGLISAARMEEQRNKRGSLDYRRASGVMRDVLVKVVNESYEPELAALRCSVDFVVGANDTEVPVGIAERATQLLHSETTLTVVPGATHYLPVEMPHVIHDAVARRLAS